MAGLGLERFIGSVHNQNELNDDFKRNVVLELEGAGASSSSDPVSSSASETNTLDLYCTDFLRLTVLTFAEALVFGADWVGAVAVLRDFGAGVISLISKLESDPSANLVRLGEPFDGRLSDLLPDEITVTEWERLLNAPLPAFGFSALTPGSAFTTGFLLLRVVFFCTGV